MRNVGQQLSDRWLITAPAWGDRHVGILCDKTIPAIRNAVAQTSCQHLVVIHTDQPDRVKNALLGLNQHVRRLHNSSLWYERLSFGHRDTVLKAGPGDFVCFLASDMILSPNALVACEWHFRQGKRLIGINATRAMDNIPIPEGMSSRELSAWAWDNRNPMTRESTYPDGHGTDWSRLYFESASGTDATCRMYLIHPLAIVVDQRVLSLKWMPTVDCRLADGYSPQETHIVTDPDELSVIELSPIDKGYGREESTLGERIHDGRIQDAHHMHHARLRHRIIIKGTGEGCGDAGVIAQLSNGQVTSTLPVAQRIATTGNRVDWAIVIPVWGPSGRLASNRHFDTFQHACLPAVVEASRRISGKARFIIHTDMHKQIEPVMQSSGVNYILQGVPAVSNDHNKLSACHRMAVAEAREGEAIAFINADMVPSVEVFSAAERAFAAGKRMILMAGTRTLSEELPPIGSPSIKLLRWVWANRHPWIRGCTWGEGKTILPSQVFFHQYDDVILHGFHLHPFAVVKDRLINFTSTIDYDMGRLFKRSEIHVVTRADEASFAEISPESRDFGYQGYVITIRSIAKWATCTLAEHRWLFTIPIAIQGDGHDIGDRMVVNEVLRALG